MPFYDYECTVCGHIETLMAKSDDPTEIELVCESQGNTCKFVRQVSAPAGIVKNGTPTSKGYVSRG